MAIGNNIRKYRKERGYTRRQFAELIDMSYNTLRCYECGTVKPEPSTLLKIAIVLEISIPDILKD